MEQNLHELMAELAERIKSAPAEKQADLRNFLSGYLAALERMQEQADKKGA